MANKEQIKDTEQELKNYAVIEALSNTEGGQRIVSLLKDDILSAINDISAKYKTASHAELIAVSAKLSERITLFRVFSRASKNKKLTKDQLEELLKEEDL